MLKCGHKNDEKILARMSIETYLTFIVAATVLILAPGPSVMVIVSHAMSLGVHNSLFTIAGIALSDIFFISIAAFGLATFVLVSASLLPIIKWCGVAYLIWLGIQQWPGQEKLESYEEKTVDRRPYWSLFLQGFAVNTTNPKALIFYAAFFPPFLNPDVSIVSQLLILLITFIVISIVVSLCYAILAAKSSNFFSNPKKRKIQSKITALLLILAGVILGVAE